MLEDLAATLGDAEGAAPGVPAPVSPVLSRRDRPVVSIATHDIDPGPVLVLSADLGLLDAAGKAWEQRARALQGECDRARLHLKGRVEVDSSFRGHGFPPGGGTPGRRGRPAGPRGPGTG